MPLSPANNTLVVPMSALSAFRRCPKSYELGYVRLLDPIIVSDAVTEGSGFHREMEAYANERRGVKTQPFQSSDAMHEVAVEYLRRKGAAEFDAMAQVIAVEQPLFTKVAPHPKMVPVVQAAFSQDPLPDVYLRTTFDLVYKYTDDAKAGWIAGRDYKTFERAPTLDVDLDFQGRIYIAALMQYFKTDRVRFEYEYVRRVVPGTKNSKGAWTQDECYINVPLVISADEARQLWSEVQMDVGKLLIAYALGGSAWGRYDLKAGPHSCNSCFYKQLCKMDMAGSLDEQSAREFANKREAPALPPEEPGTNPEAPR